MSFQICGSVTFSFKSIKSPFKYMSGHDISAIDPCIEENIFLWMFDLGCISLFRALCNTTKIILDCN